MKPVNKFLDDEHITKIEKNYNAKYVIDACLRSGEDGAWGNFPAAIFYSEEPHPQGSNYMALYWSMVHAGWVVNEGKSAVQGVFNGFLFEDGELVHSRYRHDYFVHRGAMVDGGRDYFRCGERPDGAKSILFKVDGPNLIKIDE